MSDHNEPFFFKRVKAISQRAYEMEMIILEEINHLRREGKFEQSDRLRTKVMAVWDKDMVGRITCQNQQQRALKD